jgi:hypothetical protein
MNAFLVDLANKPGSLADVAEALGAKGINIETVTGASCGDSGRALIGTNDEAATRAALQGIGASFSEVEVVEASLPHAPGSLGKAARRLAEAGINIDAITPTGMSGGNVTVAFVTSDPARAREILATAGSVA